MHDIDRTNATSEMQDGFDDDVDGLMEMEMEEEFEQMFRNSRPNINKLTAWSSRKVKEIIKNKTSKAAAETAIAAFLATIFHTPLDVAKTIASSIVLHGRIGQYHVKRLLSYQSKSKKKEMEFEFEDEMEFEEAFEDVDDDAASPFESQASTSTQSGRWVRRNNKIILYGV